MNGRVEVRTFDAPSLRGNPLGDPSERKLALYLPPNVDKLSALPVAYFLHGFSGNVDGWLNASAFTSTVPERIDRLLASGKVPPFIGVFVDGWTAIGGSQWINSDAIGNYRDYLAKDVVPFVDSNFPTIRSAKGRAVFGKSSGGYGALVMGRHHPDVFGHIASHAGDAFFEYCYLHDFPKAAGALVQLGSVEAWFKDFWKRTGETKMRGDDFPVLNTLAMAAAYSPKRGESMSVELPFDAGTARLKPEVWERWLRHDPVRFIPEDLASFRKLTTVFVDCGTRDEFSLRWGARMISEELRKGGIDHVHEEFEDGHMGINYRYDRSLQLVLPRMG